jgi:hypothetical protein
VRQNLIYGKISWSYDEEITRSELTLPVPLFEFNPFILWGKKIELKFSDKVCFKLLSTKEPRSLSIKDLYREWIKSNPRAHHSIGEGRSLLEWMKRNGLSVKWKKSDLSFHPYFDQTNSFTFKDEYSEDHAFSIPPIEACGRRVKLYVKDEDVLRLLHLPEGEHVDFLELVRGYVMFRIERETWHGPIHSFVDWVSFSGKKPLFLKDQLFWDRSRYFT